MINSIEDIPQKGEEVYYINNYINGFLFDTKLEEATVISWTTINENIKLILKFKNGQTITTTLDKIVTKKQLRNEKINKILNQ